MVYLIYILIGLAFLHFIYEGIIVPSLRLKLRFEFFSLRDQLRKVKASEPENVSEEIFRSLQNGLNNSIRLLARTDIVTLFNAHKKISKDPKLRDFRDKQWRMLQESLNETTRPIFERSSKLFLLAILVNNGMVALYLLPLFIALVICLFATHKAIKTLSAFMDIVYIPENQVDNVIPADQFAAA